MRASLNSAQKVFWMARLFWPTFYTLRIGEGPNPCAENTLQKRWTVSEISKLEAIQIFLKFAM